MAKTPKYAGINPLERLHPGEPYFFISGAGPIKRSRRDRV